MKSKQCLDTAVAIQQIAAPTFAEAERAGWVEQQFKQFGLHDVAQDRLHNVYGRLPGSATDQTEPVVVSAHTDTVFPAPTDLTVRYAENNRIYGPGIADNSTGVAGLLWLIQSLQKHNLKVAKDIWFVANVGEEGLGDLCGMRLVVDRFGTAATYIVIEGGSLGHIIHAGIGVNRFRVTVKAQGGHSWAHFGQTSAIHTLGRIITEISQMKVPRKPKTTYNVGVIEGGTSINTIAETASFLLDLRSEEPKSLELLLLQVKGILDGYRQQPHIKVEMSQIGDRPAGGISKDAPLIQWTADALRHLGIQNAEYSPSSTDANIPLSLGATAVCLGLAHSGNVHRLEEYLDHTALDKGLGQLLLVTLAAAEYPI